jgi:hypothetical protein
MARACAGVHVLSWRKTSLVGAELVVLAVVAVVVVREATVPSSPRWSRWPACARWSRT